MEDNYVKFADIANELEITYPEIKTEEDKSKIRLVDDLLNYYGLELHQIRNAAVIFKMFQTGKAEKVKMDNLEYEQFIVLKKLYAHLHLLNVENKLRAYIDMSWLSEQDKEILKTIK